MTFNESDVKPTKGKLFGVALTDRLSAGGIWLAESTKNKPIEKILVLKVGAPRPLKKGKFSRTTAVPGSVAHLRRVANWPGQFRMNQKVYLIVNFEDVVCVEKT